jgi:hypothetical protein
MQYSAVQRNGRGSPAGSTDSDQCACRRWRVPYHFRGSIGEARAALVVGASTANNAPLPQSEAPSFTLKVFIDSEMAFQTNLTQAFDISACSARAAAHANVRGNARYRPGAVNTARHRRSTRQRIRGELLQWPRLHRGHRRACSVAGGPAGSAWNRARGMPRSCSGQLQVRHHTQPVGAALTQQPPCLVQPVCGGQHHVQLALHRAALTSAARVERRVDPGQHVCHRRHERLRQRRSQPGPARVGPTLLSWGHNTRYRTACLPSAFGSIPASLCATRTCYSSRSPSPPAQCTRSPFSPSTHGRCRRARARKRLSARTNRPASLAGGHSFVVHHHTAQRAGLGALCRGPRPGRHHGCSVRVGVARRPLAGRCASLPRSRVRALTLAREQRVRPTN